MDTESLTQVIISRLDRIEKLIHDHQAKSHKDHIDMIERVSRLEQRNLTLNKMTNVLFGIIGGLISFAASLFLKGSP